jgi:hypothetical protein
MNFDEKRSLKTCSESLKFSVPVRVTDPVHVAVVFRACKGTTLTAREMQERKTEEARESVYPARIAILKAHPTAH